MESKERHRAERVKTAFEVVNATPPIEGLAYLSNLSLDGALLEGASSIPGLGRTVCLSVRLGPGAPLLRITGVVARLTSSGFTVDFEKPNPELARLLGSDPEVAEAPRAVRAAPRAALQRPTPTRVFAVDCLANGHWLSGEICTAALHTLLDHLNQGEPFLRLRNVRDPVQTEGLDFLALRTEAIDLIVPADGQDGIENRPHAGSYAARTVRCILPGAVLDGTLEILDKLRVSDHLMRCAPFIVLRGGRVALASAATAPRDLARVPLVLLNTRRAIGIADCSPSPPPEQPAGDGAGDPGPPAVRRAPRAAPLEG